MGLENTDWRSAAASALEWWRDAGVDVLVDDAARDWLAPPPVSPMREAPQPEARRSGAPPESWDAFLAWRGGPDAPDAGLRGAAITATGPANATVMVLADCPDREDEPAGQLLSGPAGRLFDGMLAAIGLTRAEVHLAAVCAKRPLAGRMPTEVEAALHACARHHVGLVAPKRLLLLGNVASRAVLGADTARARGTARPFDHGRGQTVVVPTYHPRLLLDQPARKADAWKDLQLLMREQPREPGVPHRA